jgi:hypothetical protein
MRIHIVDCSYQGIVELVVAERDSQELWRIRPDEPIPAWEIEYGVAPAGFEVLQQTRPLAGVNSVLIDTVKISGRGNELPTNDAYVLEDLRVGRSMSPEGNTWHPPTSRTGLTTTSVPNRTGHGRNDNKKWFLVPDRVAKRAMVGETCE